MFEPYIIEKENGSDRTFDISTRLFKDRIIMVVGEIEERMANIIKAQLLWLEAEDSEAEIIMYIDSPGGVISTGLGIYDTMQYVNCDIRTICIGQACSMASLLLAAGTKGKRYALPNSEIMIHQPSGGIGGTHTDIEIYYKKMNRTRKNLERIYSEITGKSSKQIEKDLNRGDNWLTAEEAIDYGLIDYVLTKNQ